jgi:hypothetical protein
MISRFCIAAEVSQPRAAAQSAGTRSRETMVSFVTGPFAGAIVLGVCILVVGCAVQPQQPQPAIAAASPSARVAPIDGSYNGIAQLVSGAAVSCGTQDPVNLQVRNGAFNYVLNQPQVPWQPRRSFDVVIAPDGSFQAQSGPASISGQVSQGHMHGQIVGDACGYQFEADNSGTW